MKDPTPAIKIQIEKTRISKSLTQQIRERFEDLVVRLMLRNTKD